jgi:hypothetical protein
VNYASGWTKRNGNAGNKENKITDKIANTGEPTTHLEKGI